MSVLKGTFGRSRSDPSVNDKTAIFFLRGHMFAPVNRLVTFVLYFCGLRVFCEENSIHPAGLRLKVVYCRRR